MLRIQKDLMHDWTMGFHCRRFVLIVAIQFWTALNYWYHARKKIKKRMLKT